MSTPRKLIAALSEYWHMENLKHYEQGSYNLSFIANLFSTEASLPDPPKRRSEIVKDPAGIQKYLKSLEESQ